MKQLLIILTTSIVLFSCKNNADTQAEIERAKKATIDSINAINVARQQAVDSMKAVKAATRQSVVNERTTVYNSAGQATEPAKKKGWSATAKGAVIGAGTGAAAGAIINHKDRVKGAAVGAILGAGAGAGTGAIIESSKKKKTTTSQ